MPGDQKPIGLLSATTLVTASMIGVGVYTTSGFTLAALGSPGLVVLAWSVAGVIAICGAIGYSSLAIRFTESGGEYMFLSRSLHPVAGLMAGWVSLLAGFTGAIAASAFGVEEYLRPLIGFELPERSIAIATILLCAILHTIGVGGAVRVQDAVVILKLVMIAAIVAVSLRAVGHWSIQDAAVVPSNIPIAFVSQLVWISFSYAGFNAAVYVADEIVDPKRNVPRAMIGATVAVTFIYIILNTVFVFAPPAAQIVAADQIKQVATTAAQWIGGDAFSLFVRSVIVVSLFTSVSALVMSGPRVYAKMAEDGFFPSWFQFHDRPPVVAIWFQAVIAILVTSISTLKDLLGYLGLTLSVCSALTVSMVFVLRYRKQIDRLPLWGIPAATYVIATLVLAVLYAIEVPRQTAAVAITILIGLVLYPWTGNPSQTKEDA
jgi:amino acid transporter